MGEAYLNYSFARGTDQEVEFLLGVLGLAPGMRLLDVGCGPGRHALALADRGLNVVGVDVAERFVELGNAAGHPNASFVWADARTLAYEGEFDAAISLCQGAFGVVGGPGAHPVSSEGDTPLDPDGVVLAGMARALKPGGVLACSAFSAYFQVRYLEDFDTFDADAGVNHERTTVRNVAGDELEADLWTSCFTPRELRLLADRCGLTVEHIWSVTPGAYAARSPTVDTPEFLLVARRPTS
ncbi:MAG: class I SAM-dependent methyltransferase [Acidimicrobiales bacterium]|nr:class I SAM-dependent methyltransferase [Acidimicrobiales bacterium]